MVRFERHGGPPDLQAAFKHLIEDHLRGHTLDDEHARQSALGEFPDFVCFNGLLLIEMKHLETGQQDRLNAVLQSKLDPAEAPVFFGTREASSIVGAVHNGVEINAEVAAKLGRTIEQLLSKANRQFRSYRARNPRKNSVTLCVVLNSALREFSPEVVAHAIHGKMKSAQPAEPRFPEIDAVLYISEKHYRNLPDGRAGLAIMIYEAVGALQHPWKMDVVERVVDAWSHMRTGGAVTDSNDPSGFEPVHDVPEAMKRHEAWSLEYARNPYLQNLPLEKLRLLFHRTIAVNSLTFVKGSWPKPPKEEVVQGMRRFQHIIEETNRRGVDLRLFDRRLLTPDETAEVYDGLPSELTAMLNPECKSTRNRDPD